MIRHASQFGEMIDLPRSARKPRRKALQVSVQISEISGLNLDARQQSRPGLKSADFQHRIEAVPDRPDGAMKMKSGRQGRPLTGGRNILDGVVEMNRIHGQGP